MKKQTKIWHYTKMIMIPVVGNLYRCVYQGPANVVRFLYDFFRRGPGEYLHYRREIQRLGSEWYDLYIQHMKYEYDGIANSEVFQKWPTYTKTLPGIFFDGNTGNCMDYAHAVKTIFKKTKIRIYIPDLQLTKVHYLAEIYDDTYELIKSGVQAHADKTARQVMEERYPDNTIYRVW